MCHVQQFAQQISEIKGLAVTLWSQELTRSMISASFSEGRVTVMATMSNLNPSHTISWEGEGG